MNKLLTTGLILLSLFSTELGAYSYTVSTIETVPTESTRTGNAIYSADLTRVERYLFDRTYTRETNAQRLTRIEKELFDQSYPNMTISQRMNNVIANYRTNDFRNGFYTSNNRTGNYYRPNSIRQRMMNSLIGQPTGFTPAITNSSYINRFGPSFSRGFYGNNGWGYHNSFRPTFTGAGIHILD